MWLKYVIATTAVSTLMPKFLLYSRGLLGSGSVLFLGEAGQGYGGQYEVTGLYSCPVSGLGADPFTVLFSHVVES